jgi:NADPH-dependent 2,4-dienoyl-CoA reductase/sulfur reductase-like enzyme
MVERVVVIGGGAAGASAASRAKKLKPSAEVVLIEATNMITHGPCAIPYYIGGIVKDRSLLVTYTPEVFERERGVKVFTSTVAREVDVDKRVVVVERGGRSYEVKWDRLVLATGAVPSIPRVPGVNLGNVHVVRHPAYAEEMLQGLAKASKVAIIGGSYLGLEMAEALLRMGKKVLLVEMESQLLPKAVDRELAELVSKEVLAKGVELHLSEHLEEVVGKNGVVSAIATNNGVYDADAVVLATGVKPNVGIAMRAGVRLGVTGAVEVNEYMETSTDGVYAAGDVAEKVHRVTGKRVWIPLAPSANKEGQVAGANAVSGRALRFPGVVGTAVTKFFELYIARTGLSEKEAIESGFKVASAVIKARTKAHYYPSHSEVVIKMVVETSTGRILGVQVIGWEEAVARYIDAAAIAIERGMTIEDLFFSDLGYHPAVAPVWHPLIVAARVLSRGRF